MDSELTPVQTDPGSGLRSRSAPIIERAPLPIVEVQGSAHVISYVNSAFCRLLGKSREELIGKFFAEIVQGGDKCVPILDQIYETGESISHTHEGTHESSPATWLYTMWPALDENERPMGAIIQLTNSPDFRQNISAINEALLLAALRQHELTELAEKLNAQLREEVTERRQAENELKAAKAELAQHAERLEQTVIQRTGQLRETIGELEAFSYTVSHDMRAPLRAMQGFAKLLLAESAPKLNAEEVSHLHRIAAAAARMDALILDVLAYTRVLKMEMTMKPMDLHTLLRQIIDTYPPLHARDVTIQIEGALPTVTANEASLSQCVSNLLTNAVKFMAPGTKPRLKVWAEEIGAEVRLWVEDNGVGIAPQDRERIFHMFERAGNASAYEGTGIGLAIVRKAVARMGGRAGVESEAGQGSRFWIQLKKG